MKEEGGWAVFRIQVYFAGSGTDFFSKSGYESELAKNPDPIRKNPDPIRKNPDPDP